MEKYSVLEIVPLYLAGKKIKRDSWWEVEYIQFNKDFIYQKGSDQKSMNIKYNEKYVNTCSCYLSPLEVIDKCGIKGSESGLDYSTKKWILVD
jgi:hypothetical protein